MELSDMQTRSGASARVALTTRIEALSARVEGLLSQRAEAGSSLSSTGSTARRTTRSPAGDRNGGYGSDSFHHDASDPAWSDQVSYLQSALTQRSVEAEEWMSADREARKLLEASQRALGKSEKELERERAARLRAEEDILRLTEELETLTRLLVEVEEREARTIKAAKTEAIADVSRDHTRQIADLQAKIRALLDEAEKWHRDRDGVERGSAEERLRTDQYRDVAEKMQALAVYQTRELSVMREQLGEAEARSAKHQQDFDQLMASYRKTRQTLSWRATAPIRKFFRALKRLLKAQPQSS